jgi:hypothetical protein
MPIVLTTCGAETRKISVQSQPTQIVQETLLKNNQHIRGLLESLKWYSACLASVKPSVQTLVLLKQKGIFERGEKNNFKDTFFFFLSFWWSCGLNLGLHTCRCSVTWTTSPSRIHFLKGARSFSHTFIAFVLFSNSFPGQTIPLSGVATWGEREEHHL